MLKMKKAIPQKTPPQEAQVKDFFDLVSPGAVKFNVDHYILGDSYRCAWAVREYPPTTPAQAILARFGEREGVTLPGVQRCQPLSLFLFRQDRSPWILYRPGSVRHQYFGRL